MDSPKNRLAPPAKDRERRLAHSNSTSRLFVHKKKTIIEEPREEVPKRFASTEGRFSIIDEHSKDSGSDSDQDGPLPSNEQFSKQKVLRPNFSKSVDYSHSQGMTSSASRFRIVPVESRYKRGRWNCFDYYEKETIVSKTPKMSCPGPFKPVMPKNDRSVRSLNSEFIPPSAPSTQVAFNFDISSDSDRENAEPLFNKSSRSFSKEVQVMPCKTAVQSAPNNKNLGVECCANGRMTPTEMLQSGLEKSLNTSEIKMEVDVNYQKNEIKRDNSNCTSSNNNGNSPAMVAIDSKIEQAMDLVKTHLMFAVREEVEVLRAKIVELESHIHHLEAENSILKEHIPDDILKNLSISSKNA